MHILSICCDIYYFLNYTTGTAKYQHIFSVSHGKRMEEIIKKELSKNRSIWTALFVQECSSFQSSYFVQPLHSKEVLLTHKILEIQYKKLQRIRGEPHSNFFRSTLFRCFHTNFSIRGYNRFVKNP